MKNLFINFICTIVFSLAIIACESKEEVQTEGEVTVSFTAELPHSMVNRAPKVENDTVSISSIKE